VAKNVVAAGLATKCSIQLAYAIGIAHPTSIYVNTFGTGLIPDENLSDLCKTVFDLTPKGMIEKFNLLDGEIYKKLPKTLFLDKHYQWEQTDKVNILKNEVK